MKVILTFLVILCLMVCAVAACVGIFIMRPPAAASQITPVVVTTAMVQQAKTRVSGIEPTVQAALAGPPGTEVSVEITQEEATALAAEALATEELPFEAKNVQVNFRKGKILISASVNIGGIDLPVVGEASATAVNGKPVVRLDSISAGIIPVPDSFRQQIDQFLSQGLPLDDLTINVTEIRSENGKLIMRGVKK